MNSALELQQSAASDGQSTKAQMMRPEPNMPALAACLIGMAVPFPQRLFDGFIDSSWPHYFKSAACAERGGAPA